MMKRFQKSTMIGMLLASTLVTGMAVTPNVAEARHTTKTVEVYVNVDPPAPKVEVVPKPRRGWVWVDGYWIWKPKHNAYVWKKGHWERARAQRTYEPGHWEKRPGGWIWVEAHWARGAH